MLLIGDSELLPAPSWGALHVTQLGILLVEILSGIVSVATALWSSHLPPLCRAGAALAPTPCQVQSPCTAMQKLHRTVDVFQLPICFLK